MESLGRILPTMCWPNLRNLDLSYNSIDYRGLLALIEGYLIPESDLELIGVLRLMTLEVLKLAGCKINPSTAPLIER